MRFLIAVAVVVALGAVGYMLGDKYIGWDPEMGARVGAAAGIILGLVIHMAMRPHS